MSSLLPNGKQHFDDNNGKPLVGGLVYYYIPNTSTPKNTWQDQAMTILNTNPIVLDARGECTAWGSGSYRQVLRDALGNLIWDRLVTDVTAAITDEIDNLKAEYAAPDGSSKIGFIQAGTGAVARTAQSKMREVFSVVDFGADPTGVADSTDAINNALQAAYQNKAAVFLNGGNYKVSDPSSRGYALLNPGVSMYGVGKMNSVIAPSASMPNSSHIMLVQPPVNGVLDFMYLRDFMIYPAQSGTKRGSVGIYFSTLTLTNAGLVKLSNLYIAPGNNYSIRWENDGNVNAQGCPSNMVVEGCSIWEGVYFSDAGDNIRFVDNVFRSTEGSFRPGILFSAVHASGGTAAGLYVARNAANCDGGFVIVQAGHMPIIEDNNYEQSAGTGSANGALIDLQGTFLRIGGGRVSGNAIGTFGTTTASTAIRIGTATGVYVNQNRISAGLPLQAGVTVSAQAQGTRIGYNQVSTTVTDPVRDLGASDTAGLTTTLTPQGGFVNAGGAAAPASVYKDVTGKVTLTGLLNNPSAVTTPTTILLLPVGMRPPTSVYLTAYAIVGGVQASTLVTVDASGIVLVQPNGSLTQVSVSGLSFELSNMLVNNA